MKLPDKNVSWYCQFIIRGNKNNTGNRGFSKRWCLESEDDERIHERYLSSIQTAETGMTMQAIMYKTSWKRWGKRSTCTTVPISFTTRSPGVDLVALAKLLMAAMVR